MRDLPCSLAESSAWSSAPEDARWPCRKALPKPPQVPVVWHANSRHIKHVSEAMLHALLHHDKQTKISCSWLHLNELLSRGKAHLSRR